MLYMCKHVHSVTRPSLPFAFPKFTALQKHGPPNNMRLSILIIPVEVIIYPVREPGGERGMTGRFRPRSPRHMP